MSTRQMKVKGSVPSLPSLHDLGRQIVVLENIHDAHDTRELEPGLGSDEVRALKRAKSLVFDQTEALVSLLLASVPDTVPDIIAQLLAAERRLDWLMACDMSVEEAKKIAGDVLHVIRASLPVLAQEADIALAEVSTSSGLFWASERMAIEGPSR
jgi:hypothetical protein